MSDVRDSFAEHHEACIGSKVMSLELLILQLLGLIVSLEQLRLELLHVVIFLLPMLVLEINSLLQVIESEAHETTGLGAAIKQVFDLICICRVLELILDLLDHLRWDVASRAMSFEPSLDELLVLLEAI